MPTGLAGAERRGLCSCLPLIAFGAGIHSGGLLVGYSEYAWFTTGWCYQGTRKGHRTYEMQTKTS